MMRLCTVLAAAVLLTVGVNGQGPPPVFQTAKFDADGDGKLNPKEFVQFLQTTPAKGYSKTEIRKMFQGVDANKDNGVTQAEFDKFVEMMAKGGPTPPPPTPKKTSTGAGVVKPWQKEALVKFYAKYDAKKTEEDAGKLLAKRASKGGKWFEAICSALEEKYGESPMKYAPDSAAGGESDESSEEDESSADIDWEEPESESDGGKGGGSGSSKSSKSSDSSSSKKTPKSKKQKAEEAEEKKKSKSSKDSTSSSYGSGSDNGGATTLQQNILTKFYTKYAPEKSAEDVSAIIARRATKGGDWFKELCGKLETKYGEHPESLYANQPDGSSSDSKDDSKKSKKKSGGGDDSSSGGGAAPSVTDYHTKVLATFYAKYAPDKDSAAIKKSLAKASKAGGVTWFDDLCTALQKKYGDEPRAFYTDSLVKKTFDASNSEGVKTQDNNGEAAAAAAAAAAAEEAEAPEAAAPAPPKEKTEKEQILERLSAAAQGVENMTQLEEAAVLLEGFVAQAKEAKAVAEEEARLKAEEEAKIKAERKEAARKRADAARAEAKKKRDAEEAAEEAALELEEFQPIDLEDEDNLVVVDSEVREWLEKERLSDYAGQVARYGGKLSQLMNRLSASVIAEFGMSTAETARMKRALKALRKAARDEKAAKAAKAAKKARKAAGEEEEEEEEEEEVKGGADGKGEEKAAEAEGAEEETKK